MTTSISPERASRAREIFAAALVASTLPPVIDTPEDAAEWDRLTIERETTRTFEGPKFKNVPHPDSAYAHLPMRGISQGNFVWKTSSIYNHQKYGEVNQNTQHKRAIALWPEPKRAKYRSPVSGKVVKDAKVEVKISAPHPRSACKELPLSGIGLDRTPGGYDLFTGELFETARFGRKCQATHTWTLSAAEQKSLAGRPLRYVEAA